MNSIHKYLLIALLSGLNTFVIAQTKFYLKANPTAYVGQTYVVTFVLENGKGKKIKLPQTYPGFEVVGGPNQSSNYQWVNGKTTSSTTFSYYLQALNEGTFEIPSASAVVDRKPYKTEKFKVNVKKPSKKQLEQQKRQQERRNRDPFEDFFKNRRPQQAPKKQQVDTTNWKEQVAKNLYVKMYADKSNPYVGEQVTLYLKLYQRMQTFQTQVTEMPEFDGFWKHDFQLKTDKWEKEEIDGVWYNTLMINKYALFPQRSGTFNLSKIKLETIIQLRTQGGGNSIWDQFFGAVENKRYPFESNSISIKVKDLPITNIPENFSGAVGNFRYKVSLDSTSAKTGSALSLNTKISGTGNVMMIDAPNINFPSDFEVYDPEEKEYISKKNNYISGNKKYNYLIIPKKPGNYKIDSIPFSFFDLKSKTYKTIYSEPLELEITPSANYVEEKVIVEENALDSDIKNISSINDFSTNQNKFIEKKLFWAFWSSPIFIFFILLIGKNKYANYNPDVIALNRKKANKIALQKLKLANEFLKKNEKEAFYNEMIRALWDYVSLKLDIQQEDLSKTNIKEKMLVQNVNENTANSYIEVIEKCEMAIYAPAKEMQMQIDFNQAKELIINVEGEIS